VNLLIALNAMVDRLRSDVLPDPVACMPPLIQVPGLLDLVIG
jgi:hypothetical protein